MSRSHELLEAAASAFDNGTDPFHTSWLAEHGVTLDECGDLSESIALAIRVMLALPVHELGAMVVAVTRAEARREASP